MIRRRRGHRCSVDFAVVGNKVSHIYSTLHRVISQLRVLASHTGSLGSVAWKLEDLPMGRCHFLSDPCVFGYIF